MKPNKFNKRIGIRTWMSSCVIFVTLSIIVNMIGYSVAIDVMTNEIQKNNENALFNVRSSCDAYFDELKASALSLLMSNTVAELNKSYLRPYERTMLATRILPDMIRAQENNEVFSIIFKDRGIGIAAHLGLCDLKLLYETTFKNFYESSEEWIEDVFSLTGDTLVTKGYENRNKEMFLIYNVPGIATSVSVVVQISRERVESLLGTVAANGGFSVLADENGTLIAGDNNVGNELVNANDIRKIKRLGRENYVVNALKSNSGKYNYVRFVPEGEHLKNINKVRTASVLGYVFCAMLVAFAYIFFHFHTENEKERETQIQKYKAYARKDTVKKILTGRLSDVDRNEFSEIDSLINSSRFMVMLFEILPEFDGTDARIREHEYYNNLYDYVYARLEIDKLNFLTSRNENTFTVLIGMVDADESDRIIALAEQICRTVSVDFEAEIRCAVSNTVDGFAQIHIAFEQAVETNALCMWENEKIVYLYSEAMAEAPELALVEIEKKLTAFLGCCDYEKAKSFVQEVMDENIPTAQMQTLLSQIMLTLLKTAEMNEGKVTEIQEMYIAFGRLGDASRFGAIKSLIIRFIDNLSMCMNVGSDEGTVVEKKYRDIKDYINENYADPLLDMNMIAEKFNIHKAWASQKFKQNIGVSIPEYIIKCRIEKAKSLLKTDMTIEQIVEAVGFSNKVTYCRLFKKYEGITSSQYRRILDKNKED